jgi:hypothetical protein
MLTLRPLDERVPIQQQLGATATPVVLINVFTVYPNPLTASRSLAMMHLAMHDAANAARPRYQRYAEGAVTAASTKADAAVAAATAAHDVMAALYSQVPAIALLKAELEKTMLEAGVGPEISAGIALGKAAAKAVLAKRANDGSNGNESYVEGTCSARCTDWRITAHGALPRRVRASAPHSRRSSGLPAPRSRQNLGQ